MTNPLDIIKQQAALVRDPKAAEKAAEALEEFAKILRGNVAKKESFAVIKQRNIDERSSRVEKFGAAIRARKIEDRHNMLVQAGWLQGFRNDATGEATYGIKAKPGVQLKIADGKFSVVHGPALLQEKLDMICLPGYLDKFKKENNL